MFTSGGPKWWLLYVGFVVFVILFVGEVKLPVPGIEHRVIEVVLVLTAFGLMHLWLNANANGLLYRPRVKSRVPREKQTRK
jgi:hypothetical protein